MLRHRYAWHIALYVLAFLAHLPFLFTPIYGDEGVQYTMSRHWGHYESRGTELTTDQVVEYGLVFWQRPAFPILLSPGAAMGFEAMRIEFMLLTSLLAPLGFELLRTMRAPLPWAAAGGAGVALHPTLALWGTRIFPDALAATFLLAGVVAHQHRRPAVAGGLLVVGTWAKEILLAPLVGLAILAALQKTLDWRRGDPFDWRSLVPYGVALVLAPLPLLYVLSEGARLPGWTFSGGYQVARLFVGFWTIPLLAFLLLRKWLEPLPWLAVGFPLLFIIDHRVRGITIEEWYFVMPTLFVLLALAAALGQIAVPVVAWLHSTRPRHAPVAMASIVALVLVFPALGFAGVNDLGIGPRSERRAVDYFRTFAVSRAENQDFPYAVEAVRGEHPSRIILVDVGWFNIEHPFGDMAPAVQYVYPGCCDDPWLVDKVGEEMRRPGTVTVLQRTFGHEVFSQIEADFADCRVMDRPQYFVVRGADCPASTQEEPLVPLISPR